MRHQTLRLQSDQKSRRVSSLVFNFNSNESFMKNFLFLSGTYQIIKEKLKQKVKEEFVDPLAPSATELNKTKKETLALNHRALMNQSIDVDMDLSLGSTDKLDQTVRF